MKSLLALVVLLAATSAFARQYIQCSSTDIYTTDVAVLNIQSKNTGTFFISSGMQNDETERALFKIEGAKEKGDKVVFAISHKYGKGEVSIAKADIGVSSNFVQVEAVINGIPSSYSCFSRIYND